MVAGAPGGFGLALKPKTNQIQFIDEDIKESHGVDVDTTKFLNDQLDQKKTELDEQDAKLAAFQRRYVGSLPEDSQANLAFLNGQTTQLEAATQALNRAQQDKSFAESSNALLGGHIHAVSDAAGWAPLVNAGQLRLLVSYGSNRTRNWPTVPTLREVGIDVVANSAYGVAGPKGMSEGVVKILHDAFKKGMEDPMFVALLKKLEQEPIYQSTEDYRAYIERELVVQRQLVEELGLKLE